MALVILVCVFPFLSQCGRRVEHLHWLLVHQRLRDCLLYALSIVAQLAAWGKSINNKRETQVSICERWDTCIINIPHTPCVTANEISFDLFWLSRSHTRLSRQQLERTHTQANTNTTFIFIAATPTLAHELLERAGKKTAHHLVEWKQLMALADTRERGENGAEGKL